MSFFGEMKHRNVFRVGIAFTFTVWVLIQALSVFLSTIKSPDLVINDLITALIAGFPMALIFAWVHKPSRDEVKLRTGNNHPMRQRPTHELF